jgi:uncharacterized protein (TIGR02118 family)
MVRPRIRTRSSATTPGRTPPSRRPSRLRRFEAARGIATPDGGDLPYQRIADLGALQAGMASDEGQAAVDDIRNFASGGVTLFIAEIDD